jgi:broad specificity phosphatase PhoE
MKTTMYLIRHAGVTGAERPKASDDQTPLAKLEVRQAEATRDFLAIRPIDYCYCSPPLAAVQTASIIAEPHGLTPCTLGGLAHHSGADAILEDLFARHTGHVLLVVTHHDVGRAYLAGLLGLTLAEARQVHMDNCGISVVVREKERATVNTLNASFHLQGIAA